MRVGATGQGLYIYDCMTRTDRIPSIYEDYFYGTPQAPVLLGDITEPAQPKLHPQTLAATTIQMDLIQLYFMHVHPYLPILHRASFHAQLQKAPCILLLNAMYAVASRWHPSARETITSDGHPPGWRYYQAAFSLIDIYTDTPRLSTVQALLLMVKYQEHVRRPGFFWRTRYYFQNIVHMCRDLGLCKALGPGFQLDMATAEQRRRTFWAVYAYDIMMSTELGAEPHFSESSCTIDYPNLLPDETQPEDREALLHFHWLAKLVHIHGSILHFVRKKYTRSSIALVSNRKESEDNSNFRHLQQRLEDLGTKMSSVVKPSGHSYASSFQLLLLHSSTILLHRPYALDQDSSVSQERCTDSASTITHLVENLLNTRGVECFYYPVRGIQYTVYCLAAAITVHKCLSDIQGHQEACNKSLAVMQQLLDKTPATEVDTVNEIIQQDVFQQQWSPSAMETSLSPSSSRSSPILASSNDVIRSKSRRTSLASLPGAGSSGNNVTNTTTSKRRARAASHLGTLISNSNTTTSTTSPTTTTMGHPPSGFQQGGMASTGVRNPVAEQRIRTGSQHRLSMPILGYQSSQYNFSQPSSTATTGLYNADFYAALGNAAAPMIATSSKPSPFYKQALRSSSVAAAAAQQQQQQQHMNQPSPPQYQGIDEQPMRTVSTPYTNRQIAASHRRHTISGTYQQQQQQHMMSSVMEDHVQPTEQELFHDSQQDMLMDYPMDPGMALDPSPPTTGSMMELLLDPATHHPFMERGA
ncbi:hypothetical protein K492DRAFT_1660 [Lichtheimia hyalospora FSU 10163]|nr:hypothetical protein K492DRAFT_1660 [Lichtheimia hyalospora FSU 10163]